MLEDVTFVLLARPATGEHGATWLDLLREHPALSTAGTLVIDEDDDAVRTLARTLAEVRTGYFSVLWPAAPPPDAADLLVDTVRAGLAEVRAVGVGLAIPLLLGHRFTPVELVTAYIDEVLATHSAVSDDVSDYLGYLALRSARVTVEWIDPRDGDVDVGVRLNLAGHRFATRPPWRFRVALAGPAGHVARSQPARLAARVDARGATHWEWLTARLPLADVPGGDYTIAVALASASEALRLSRTARPSTGALTAARTVRLSSDSIDGHRGQLRYQLHTPAHGREARLRVGVGSGRAADLRWNLRMLGADLHYIARGEGGRRMRLMRLVRLVTTPLFAGREIWLIGERAEEAQDNGLHLFRYLRTRHPLRHVYYVLARSSPLYAKARRLGHVVPHSSVRHQLLLLHASVLANAHSLHHMLPRTWTRQAFVRRLAWRVEALQVFLQHGVHLSPEAVKRGNSGYDVILTSAPRESAALRAVSGYDEQIAEVGLPRFDHLTPTPPSRTILVMPTWRRYLPSKLFGSDRPGIDPFEGSGYERFMTGLLTSESLHRLLTAHDYRLVFLPHSNVAHLFAGARTAGERITLATAGGSALQELVRRCDVFVTDHSSVHFDAAYLGTPVVYAQFDRAEYESRHAAPSWFDVERDGFGPVATTVAGLVDELAALLGRGCRLDPRYARRVTEVFAYHDRDNARRAVATIDSHLRRARDAQRPGTKGAAAR